jgi:hypothetical protein
VTYRTLTKCTPTGGTILNSPTGTTFVNNTVVTLTADPNPGYDFSAWTGSITGSTNPVNITMNANKSVCATFVVDNTPPVITRTGNATIYVECGSAYTDAGATASDNRDGNITSRIVVGGLAAVDENTPGTYTITYNVQDDAENSATQVTRTVIVQDTEGPVITLLGDSVIYMECGATAEDPGATAVDTCEGEVAEEIDVVGLDLVGGNGPGEYSVTYEVADQAGNLSQATRTYVVLEDTEAPVITVSGSRSFPVGSTYSGIGATAYDACEGDLTSTIVVGGDTVNTAVPGSYVVTYNVTDSAGNAAEQKTETVMVYIVTYDGVSFESESSTILESDTVVPLSLKVHNVGNANATTVFYRLSGSASPGTDYDAEDGEIYLGEIPLGETRSIEIPILDDEVGEYDETLIVTLWKTLGGPIMEPSVHTLTIENDDDPALTVRGPSNGSVILTPPVPAYTVESGDEDYSAVYDYGTEVFLQAVPDPGYVFWGWGDDLLGTTPQIEFVDEFGDFEINPAWTIASGNWTEASGEYISVAAESGVSPQLTRSHTLSDYNLRFEYRRGTGTAPLDVWIRWVDADNNLRLSIDIDQVALVEEVAGVASILATATGATSSGGNWYQVEVESSDEMIRVWRKPMDGVESLILNAATTTSNTELLGFLTGADTAYDVDNLVVRQLRSRASLVVNEPYTVSAVFLPDDTVPPSIVLLGAPEMHLALGEQFSDPGATALDERHGDLTWNIVVGGNIVDPNAPGTYLITYDVEDRDGNAAPQVTRTVIVEAAVTEDVTLTLSLPTTGFIPDIQVTGGVIYDRGDTTRLIRVIEGGTVTLEIPVEMTVNANEDLAFSHWASPGESFNGSRAATVEIVMTEPKTVEVMGTSNFHKVNLRDHFEPSPLPWGSEVRLGGATFTVDPADAQLPYTSQAVGGFSTWYYFLDGAEVALTPVPESGCTFERWEVTEANEFNLASPSLTLPVNQDWTVQPLFLVDPHILTINIESAGAGKIGLVPDPINGESSPAQRVEYFNPFRESKTVKLRAVEVLESNHRFHHWVGGTIDGLTDHEVSIELIGNTEVGAVFIPSFPLSVRTFGGGSVNITPPGRDITANYDLEYYPDPSYDESITEPVTVTLTPQLDDSLYLDHWVIDSVPNHNTGPLTIVMSQARDVRAVFLPADTPNGFDFQLFAGINGEGTIHLVHSAPHEDRDTDVTETFEERLTGGTQVLATATPGTGMVLDYWLKSTDAGTVVEMGTLPAITADTAIVANFRESGTLLQKSITVERYGLGYIVPSPGILRCDAGAPVRFFASPAPGWRFAGWVGGPNNDSSDVTVTVNNDLDVVAYFEPEGEWGGVYTGAWYNLEMEAAVGGSVLPGASRFPEGAEVPITAVPDEGWSFHHWEGDLVDGSENDSETIVLGSHVYVRAVFEPLVEFSIPAPEVLTGGSFTISPEKPEGYRLGDEITLTPVPEDGWEFDRWVGDVSTESISRSNFPGASALSTYSDGEEGEVTTTISNAPFDVRPIFKRKKYGLEVHTSGPGTVHIASVANRYGAGEAVKLVALASPDHDILRWKLDGTDMGGNDVLEFTMPSDNVQVTADFGLPEDSYYTVYGSAWMKEGLGWRVSVSGEASDEPPGVRLPAGSSFNIIAYDNSYLKFSHWVGDISGTNPVHSIVGLDRDLEVFPVFVRRRLVETTISASVYVRDAEDMPEGVVSASPAPDRVEITVIPNNLFGMPIPGAYGYWTGIYDDPSLEQVTLSAPGKALLETRAYSAYAQNGETRGYIILGDGSFTLELPPVDCRISPDNRPYKRTAGIQFTPLSDSGSFDPDKLVVYAGEGGHVRAHYRTFYRDIQSSGFFLPNGTYDLISPLLLRTQSAPEYSYNLSGHADLDYLYDYLHGEKSYSVEPLSPKGVKQTFSWTFEEKPEPSRTIVTYVEGEGTVTGAGLYDSRETISLHATPEVGWKFRGWGGGLSSGFLPSVSSNDNPLIITECNPVSTHRAVFERICDDITLSTSQVGEGCIVIDRNKSRYDCDEEVELLAVADTGYKFVGWGEDEEHITNTDNPLGFPMTGSKALNAVFAPDEVDFTVSVDIDNDGTPEPYIEGTEYLWNVPLDLRGLNDIPPWDPINQVLGGLNQQTQKIHLDFGNTALDDTYRIEIVQPGNTIKFYRSSEWVTLHAWDMAVYWGAREPLGEIFEPTLLQDSSIYAVAHDSLDGAETETDVTVEIRLIKGGTVLETTNIDFRIAKEELGTPSFFAALRDFMRENNVPLYSTTATVKDSIGLPEADPPISPTGNSFTYDISIMDTTKVRLKPLDIVYGPISGLYNIDEVVKAYPDALTIINGVWFPGLGQMDSHAYGVFNVDGELAKMSSFHSHSTWVSGHISQDPDGQFTVGYDYPNLYSNEVFSPESGWENPYDLKTKREHFEPYYKKPAQWESYEYSLSSVENQDMQDYNAVYGLLRFDDRTFDTSSPMGFVGHLTNSTESPVEFEYAVAGAIRGFFTGESGNARMDLWELFHQSGAAEGDGVVVPKIPLMRTDPRSSVALAISENGQLRVRTKTFRHGSGNLNGFGGYVNNYIAFLPRE